jgi:hypothetical protein
MGIADIVAGIFKPISDVIDHVTVSGDQKADLQKAVINGQLQAAQSTMDYEAKLLGARSDIILAEAKSGSWLASNWRPITMLTFLVLVVCDSFGWLPFRLASEAWSLLQLGLGGYVVGRSVEKTAGPLVAAVVSAIKK